MSVLEPIRSRGSGAAGIVHGNEWSWFNHARYDAGGRIASVGGTKTYASGLTYASCGGLLSMRYGNNVIETTAYSNRLQPTAIGASLNGTSLLGLSLYYCQNQAPTCTNNNGNLIGQTIYAGGPVYTQTYAYNDGLNRLTGTSENSNAWYQNYSYDPYGNRATTGNYIPGQNQTPAALNYTNNQWPVFGYDAAGNVQNDTMNSMLYDAENRMTGSSGLATVSYSYDGEGKRVQKAVTGGATTTYVYDAQGQLAAEYATASPPLLCTTCYLTADHLGSTRMMTDGTVGSPTYDQAVRRYDYLPFGEELPQTEDGRTAPYETAPQLTTADATDGKFTGKLRDNETGLDFFGARYFSGAQGRFTTPDEFKGGGLFDPETGLSDETIGPLPYADISDPQTLNKYAYVRNNPLRYVDPDGHCFEDACVVETVATVTVAAAVTAGLVYYADRLGEAIGNAMKANVDMQTTLASQTNQKSPAPPGAGPKTTEEMAKDLSGKIGKNSVPYETPTASGHIDLAGKAHHDKATGTSIPTPHVQEAKKHVGPQGQVNVGKTTTRPATKADIRTAEKLAKKKGLLP